MQNGNHCKCCAIKVFVNTKEWTSQGVLKSPDMNLSGHQNPEAASTLSHNISLHQALGWCWSKTVLAEIVGCLNRADQDWKKQ
jgi:hypothetical protein